MNIRYFNPFRRLHIYIIVYSVMQSDGNSFCQDVMLENINLASRVKNRISDQIYEKKIQRYAIICE